MENLNWLFWGYGAGWLIVMAYLLQISLKERSLRKKVSDLQEMIEERWNKKARP